MKQSFLLGVLVANLRHTANIIIKSPYKDFRVELVEDNFRAVYDVVRSVTKQDDEDKFIVKDYYDRIMSCKMDYYAQHVKTLSKDEYLTLIKNIIGAVIDNAARKDFQMQNVDIGVCSSTDDDPPTTDGTPDDETPPPQSSNNINADVVKILRRIASNIDKLIKILEK
jgi:hypothetical protein